jgi:hypothetical protein
MRYARHLAPILVVILLIGFHAPARLLAEVLTVPLELPPAGIEFWQGPVQLPFATDAPLRHVASVALHVTGAHAARGLYWCHGTEPYERVPAPAGLTAGFVVGGSPLAETTVLLPGSPPGMLELDHTFVLAAPDWSFLEGGAGTVFLRTCGTPELDACEAAGRLEEYRVFLDAAELIVTTRTVPESTASWGAIKTIYR